MKFRHGKIQLINKLAYKKSYSVSVNKVRSSVEAENADH